MNKEEVLAFIESCNNNADCAEIQKAAKDRGAAIRSAAYKAEVDEYWKRAIFFREGQTLYCAAEGTFIGGPLQRGDEYMFSLQAVIRRSGLMGCDNARFLMAWSASSPIPS